MGVSAGEFFVNLGIKGSESAMNALNNTKGGFAGLKDMAIESKAAILAALYALERVVSTSGELGTTLKNFQSLSGVPTDVLQRYQYAAQKAGVANQSLLDSFLKLQGVAFDVRAGKGLPDWLAPIITSLSQHGKDIGPDWASRWQKDPTLALKAFQDFAGLNDIDQNTRALVLQRTGLGADLVTALMRNALTPGKLAAVPSSAILNQQDIDTLDKSRQTRDSLFSVIATKFSEGTAASFRAVGRLNDARKAHDEWYDKKFGKDASYLFPHGFSHGPGNTTKIDIHQTVNVHGADPAKTKKAARDGTMDAAREIIPSLNSAQQSH